jgi:hypothetical protein
LHHHHYILSKPSNTCISYITWHWSSISIHFCSLRSSVHQSKYTLLFKSSISELRKHTSRIDQFTQCMSDCCNWPLQDLKMLSNIKVARVKECSFFLSCFFSSALPFFLSLIPDLVHFSFFFFHSLSPYAFLICLLLRSYFLYFLLI